MFSLPIISRKTRRREEFRFLFYEGFLAGFSIITESSPDSKFTLTSSLVPSTRRIWQLVFSYQRVPVLFPSFILTAVDRGAGLTGVPPGLPQRAAAGGAADAHPNLSVAGQAPVAPRTELQVAVAHAVVCRATQEFTTVLIVVRMSFWRKVTQMMKFKFCTLTPCTKSSRALEFFQVVGIISTTTLSHV